MQGNKVLDKMKDQKISPAVLYYFDYLGFLHKLISKNIMTPYWLSMDNIIQIAENKQNISSHEIELKNKFLNFPTNRFLTKYVNSPYDLAKDLIENGSYVPMLSFQNQYFMNGSHRIGSLIGYHKNIEPITKNFLCLSFNDNELTEYNTTPTNGLELKMIRDGNSVPCYPASNNEISHLFDSNGGMATTLLFDYNKRIEELPELKKITPASCLNNPEAFDYFISYPFSDNFLSAINEHFGLYLPFETRGKESLVSFYLK